MQDVEIYIGETRSLSGTVGFQVGQVIEDLSQNLMRIDGCLIVL